MYHFKAERNLLGSVLIVIALVSCATQVKRSHFSPVFITDRVQYILLPAREMEKEVDGVQRITGKFGDQVFVMEAWVKADKSGIDMAFFNSFGAGLGNFSFNDEAVSLNSPVFPQNLKAEYLAADFQFCFFNFYALKQTLENLGLVFELSREDENGADTEIRRIAEGKNIIIEIEKTANQVRYMNFLRGYSYTLDGDF